MRLQETPRAASERDQTQNRVQRGPRDRSRRTPLLAAVLASTILAAGCGGGSPGPAPATSGRSTGSPATVAGGTGAGLGSNAPRAYAREPLAFSKCMRANGVPNFPDLSSTGMRIAASGQTISINGVSINAPAFTAARQKCERYMQDTSAIPTPARSAQKQQQDLEFARCMRSHGIPNFPDPGTSSSEGDQTVHLDGINLSAPAFQAAAKKCGGFNPKGP